MQMRLDCGRMRGTPGLVALIRLAQIRRRLHGVYFQLLPLLPTGHRDRSPSKKLNNLSTCVYFRHDHRLK